MSVDLQYLLRTLRNRLTETLDNKNGQQIQASSAERKEIILFFIGIKRDCRKEKLNLRKRRDVLQMSKFKADTNRLHLQNLLYEISHLKKEIKICYHFKSLDENIDLLPEDHVYNIDHQETHGKRLSRLQNELDLRRLLCAQYNDLLVSKKLVYKDILLNIERNSLFVPALKYLLKGSQPLKDVLKYPQNIWTLGANISSLPEPLYIAFINFHSIQVSPNSLINVNVVMDDNQSNVEPFSDSCFQPYPLMLSITLRNEHNKDAVLEIHARYFCELGIVTIFGKENLSLNNDLLENILRNVGSKDFGNSIPVAGLLSKLARMKICKKKLLSFLKKKHYGKPYIWANRMCAIQTIKFGNTINKAKSLKYSMYIIDRIKMLWSNHLETLNQAKALGCLNHQAFVRSDITYIPKCVLRQWSQVTWAEFVKNNRNHNLLKFTNKFCIYYRGVLEYDPAKMECWICISAFKNFSAALWFLNWTEETSTTDSAVLKEMESFVNKTYKKGWDLFTQLNKAMLCFDTLSQNQNKESPGLQCYGKHKGRFRYRIKPDF